MQRGSKPLNTSRLNIVGEGRAGKTAWLRAVSNKAFEDTTSTIGVKQSLLEVNKVDMETKCEGGWSVVEEGTLIMRADEAITRLAAEIAVTEEEVAEEAAIEEEERAEAEAEEAAAAAEEADSALAALEKAAAEADASMRAAQVKTLQEKMKLMLVICMCMYVCMYVYIVARAMGGGLTVAMR
jgi:ATPase subunit of ABC transporter with duplicated ATPase domains